MKKLLVALLFFCSFQLFSQSYTGTLVSSKKVLFDTTFQYLQDFTNHDVVWASLISWSSNDTAGVIVPQLSIDNSAWNNYTGIDTIVITKGTGSAYIFDDKMPGKYLRLNYITPDTSTILFTIKYLFRPKN